MFISIFLLSMCAVVKAGTSYCDDDFCSKPDKYCCGANECCSYVWSLWYLWLSFFTGILFGLFLLWKYYFQRRSALISKLNEVKANNERLASHGFIYRPLNNDVFIENHINENLIQFNIIKSSQKMFSLNEEDPLKRMLK